MPRFRIAPDRSRVFIVARSSLHPIDGQADGPTGFVDAEIVDGCPHLASGAPMRIELPIDRLKSGNVLYDRELQRRVDARRYPTISGEAQEVSEFAPGRYRVRGGLTFHGVTQIVDGEVTVRLDGDRSLVLEGEQTFDVRAFKVTPPRILAMRVHPDVKVRIHLEADAD